MTDNMQRTVLILGGYGKAGRYIADLLLATSDDIAVIIAGRTATKAQREATRLNQKHGGTRASPLTVDAGSRTGLQVAFAQCDLVIVCIPYQGQARLVLETAIGAGIHYVDINAGEVRGIDDLEPRIEARGLRFLIDAGIIPGCPSVLARYAGAHFDSVQRVTVGSLMSDPDMPYGGAFDIMSQAGKPARIYENGRWQPTSSLALRRLDFGQRFGRRLAAPIVLPELDAIPAYLNLDHLAAYQAGINSVVDTVLLTWSTLNLSRWNRSVELGTKLFLWANRTFTQSPFGLALTLNAVGTRAGRAERLTVILEQEDLYLATAIPVVAAVGTVFDGATAGPGMRFMGHAVDPVSFVTRLEQLGLSVHVAAAPPSPALRSSSH